MSGVRDSVTAKRLRFSGVSDVAGALIEDRQADDALVEYMAARGGRVQELEAEVQSLQKEKQQLLQQLDNKEAEVSSLQSELTTWKNIKDAETQNLAKTAHQLTEQLSQQIVRSKTLEAQLSKTQSEWAMCKMELGVAQSRAEDAEGQIARAQRSTAAEIADLQAQLRAAQQQAQAQEQHLQASLDLAQQRRLGEEAAHRATKQRLSECQQSASQQQAANNQLRQSLAAAEARAAKAESAATTLGTAELRVMVESLRDQLNHQALELAQARKVKAQADTAAQLAQELTAARQEAAAATAALEQLSAEHRGASQLQDEVDRWRLLFKKATGQDHPSPHALGQLQSELVRTREQLALVRADEAAARKHQQELAAVRDQAQAEASAATGDLEVARRQLALLEGQIAPLTRERNSLLRMVQLLQQALLENDKPPQQQQQQAASGAGVSPEVDAERVRVLESVVADLRSQVELVQVQYAAATDAEVQQRQRADAAELQAKALAREVDTMAEELAVLQSRVGAGDYDPAAARVLHMVVNPETDLAKLEQEQALERLEAENKALKDNMSRLEGMAGGQAAGGLDAAIKDAEISVLNKRLQSVNRGQQRLQEMFKTRIAAFRSAVKLLFGYKIEMTAEAAKDMSNAPSTIKLMPALHGAETEGHLMFRYTPGAGVALLPTPLSKQLSKEVETFVNRFQCIPALTANLTMEGFSRITR